MTVQPMPHIAAKPLPHLIFSSLSKMGRGTAPLEAGWWGPSFKFSALAMIMAASSALADPTPGQQGILNALAQRQYMLSADDRCDLLEGPRRDALGAGLLQARNEAVRQGLGGAVIYDTLTRASARARSVDCADAALKTEAGQVDNAFRSFVQQLRYELKGQRSTWTVDRAYGDDDNWRLVQTLTVDDSRFAFGLYGRLNEKSLTVMAQLPPGAEPFSARLIIRRAGQPPIRSLDLNPSSLSQTQPLGFDEAHADVFLARAHAADKRVMVKTPRTLSAGLNFPAADTPRDTERFDFPSVALRALGPLDPRDDVLVAFDYGDHSLYVRFEVSDFIPGMILSNLPSPYTHNQAHSAH